ncbi:hypothetical protein B0H12DRAFT_1148261 [Mycena haematopus]|nr:hypothetical protein B0H12DRAFT_1148261 [Mycena haematopus]
MRLLSYAYRRPPINHQNLRRDLEEYTATLKAATNDVNVEAAFQSLIHPTSDSHRPMDSKMGGDLKGKRDVGKTDNHIGSGAGALTIKPTRQSPVNEKWVKASDAARKHDLAVRRRANPKTEASQIIGPPAPPPKQWVSASDAARRTSHHRVESSHVGHIRSSVDALTIKITPHPPMNEEELKWVKASDAARKHDLGRRRAKTASQITGPPTPPPKQWISASDAARRTSHPRIESSH